MEEVRLDDERLGHRPRARVEEVELRALVAALVDGEQDPVAAGDEPPVTGSGRSVSCSSSPPGGTR